MSQRRIRIQFIMVGLGIEFLSFSLLLISSRNVLN